MERTIYEYKSELLPFDDGKRRGELTVKLGDLYNNGNIQFSIRVRTEVQNGQGVWLPESWGMSREFIENKFEDLLPLVDLHGCCFDGAPLSPVSEGAYLFRCGKRSEAMKLLRITEDEADALLVPSMEPEYFSFMLRKLGIVERWGIHAQKLMDWIDFYSEGPGIVRPFGQQSKSDYHGIDSKLKEIGEKDDCGFFSDENILKRYNKGLQEKIDTARERIYRYYENDVKWLEMKRDIELSLIDAGILGDNFICYSHSKEVTFNYTSTCHAIPDEEVERYIETVGAVRFPEVKFKNEHQGRKFE